MESKVKLYILKKKKIVLKPNLRDLAIIENVQSCSQLSFISLCCFPPKIQANVWEMQSTI